MLQDFFLKHSSATNKGDSTRRSKINIKWEMNER
jgi:hypothetical protein